MLNPNSDAGQRNIRLLIFSVSGMAICFLAIALLSYFLQPDTPVHGLLKSWSGKTNDSISGDIAAPPVAAEPQTLVTPARNVPVLEDPVPQQVVPEVESGKKEEEKQDVSKIYSSPKDTHTPAATSEFNTSDQEDEPMGASGQGS